jgi:hypothetical protein
MANLTFTNPLFSNIYSPTVVTNSLIVGGGTPSSSLNMVLAGGPSAGQTALYIYQGTVPTSFTGLADISARAADLLITFSIPSYQTAIVDNGNVGNVSRRVTICKVPTPTAATASGTATWFLTCATWSTDLTNKPVLIGTVGAAGSGADLILSTTSVVAGMQFTSLGFNLNFPYEWTV